MKNKITTMLDKLFYNEKVMTIIPITIITVGIATIVYALIVTMIYFS